MRDKDEVKSLEFYKAFYEENRVSVLQYESLRVNFNKMVSDVLGGDYYNMGMDVYEADRICCEDISNKSNKSTKSLLSFIKGFYNVNTN